MSFSGFNTSTTGGLFGTNSPTVTSAFGALGTSFGSPSTSTATTGAFGAATAPNTGAFGAATAPNTGAFGAATAPNTGAFGAATAPNTGFGTGFSTGFGTNPATGLTFGAPIATTATTAPTSASTFSNLSFGSQTSGFSFGTPTASSTLAFAAPTTTTAAVSFGTPTTASTLTFAAPSIATTSGFSFANSAATTTSSTGFTFGPATTTTGLSFGPPATSSLPKTTVGLTFGTTTTSGSTLGTLGTGSGFTFGPTTTASGLSFVSLSTTTVATSGVATSIGLGGVDTQSKIGLSGVGTLEQKHVKDQPLPEPLLQTFNGVTAFIKTQKNISLEIARGGSAKLIQKVQEEAADLESLLSSITNALVRNSTSIDKLKNSTSQGLFFADTLQGNPEAITYEDTGTNEFFTDLIAGFETTANKLKGQIEAAEGHYKSITQNASISPQEFTTALRRMHDTLIALAAQVQGIHVAALAAADAYRRMRKGQLVKDRSPPKMQAQRSLLGPTPFAESSFGGLGASGGTARGLGGEGDSGWLGGQLPTDASFLSSGNLSSTTPVEGSGFQLGKPPVGNKRNKR